MPLTLEGRFDAELAIPQWLQAILEFHSIRLGKTFVLGQYESIHAINQTNKEIRIVFPNRTDCIAVSDVLLSDAKQHFKLAQSRIYNPPANSTVPAGDGFKVAPYGAPKSNPLFVFYRGQLIITCSFGGNTELPELAGPDVRQARRRNPQPANPGQIIFQNFDKVLAEYVKYLDNYKGEDEAAAWATFRVQELVALIGKTERDITANDNEIRGFQEGIRRNLNKMHELRIVTRGAKAHIEDPIVYVKEYAQLQQVCSTIFSGISHDAEKLTVITKPVILNDPTTGHKHNYGRYKLDIFILTGEVKCWSRDGFKSYGGFPHPHVSKDHVPCFGSISRTVPELIKTGELVAALNLLHQWITGYVPGDSYFRTTDSPGFAPDGHIYTQEEWQNLLNQLQCQVCMNRFNRDQTRFCSQCSEVVCGNCKYILDGYGNYNFCSLLCREEFCHDNNIEAVLRKMLETEPAAAPAAEAVLIDIAVPAVPVAAINPIEEVQVLPNWVVHPEEYVDVLNRVPNNL